MKQRIRVPIEQIEIDGKPLELKRQQPLAELELSAIDTGGSFHDPILDFRYTIEPANRQQLPKSDQVVILQLCDPYDEENTIEIQYDGRLHEQGKNRIEGMGRLKGETMSRNIMCFVMRCVR